MGTLTASPFANPGQLYKKTEKVAKYLDMKTSRTTPGYRRPPCQGGLQGVYLIVSNY
jgi:hypothetical protein